MPISGASSREAPLDKSPHQRQAPSLTIAQVRRKTTAAIAPIPMDTIDEMLWGDDPNEDRGQHSLAARPSGHALANSVGSAGAPVWFNSASPSAPFASNFVNVTPMGVGPAPLAWMRGDYLYQHHGTNFQYPNGTALYAHPMPMANAPAFVTSIQPSQRQPLFFFDGHSGAMAGGGPLHAYSPNGGHYHVHDVAPMAVRPDDFVHQVASSIFFTPAISCDSGAVYFPMDAHADTAADGVSQPLSLDDGDIHALFPLLGDEVLVQQSHEKGPSLGDLQDQQLVSPAVQSLPVSHHARGGKTGKRTNAAPLQNARKRAAPAEQDTEVKHRPKTPKRHKTPEQLCIERLNHYFRKIASPWIQQHGIDGSTVGNIRSLLRQGHVSGIDDWATDMMTKHGVSTVQLMRTFPDPLKLFDFAFIAPMEKQGDVIQFLVCLTIDPQRTDGSVDKAESVWRGLRAHLRKLWGEIEDRMPDMLSLQKMLLAYEHLFAFIQSARGRHEDSSDEQMRICCFVDAFECQITSSTARQFFKVMVTTALDKRLGNGDSRRVPRTRVREICALSAQSDLLSAMEAAEYVQLMSRVEFDPPPPPCDVAHDDWEDTTLEQAFGDAEWWEQDHALWESAVGAFQEASSRNLSADPHCILGGQNHGQFYCDILERYVAAPETADLMKQALVETVGVMLAGPSRRGLDPGFFLWRVRCIIQEKALDVVKSR